MKLAHNVLAAVMVSCVYITVTMRETLTMRGAESESLITANAQDLRTNNTMWPFDQIGRGLNTLRVVDSVVKELAWKEGKKHIKLVAFKTSATITMLTSEQCRRASDYSLGPHLAKLWLGELEYVSENAVVSEDNGQPPLSQESVSAQLKTLQELPEPEFSPFTFKIVPTEGESSCPDGHHMVTDHDECYSLDGRSAGTDLGFDPTMRPFENCGISEARHGVGCICTKPEQEAVPRRTQENMNAWYGDRDAQESDCAWWCNDLEENKDWCGRYQFATDGGGTCALYDLAVPRRLQDNMNAWFDDRDAQESDCAWWCNDFNENKDWCIRYRFAADDGGTCILYTDGQRGLQASHGYVCRQNQESLHQREESYAKVENLMKSAMGSQITTYKPSFVKSLQQILREDAQEECGKLIQKTFQLVWSYRCEIVQLNLWLIGWAADKALFMAATATGASAIMVAVGTFMATFGADTCHMTRSLTTGPLANAGLGTLLMKIIGKALGWMLCEIDRGGILGDQLTSSEWVKSAGMKWDTCDLLSVPLNWIMAGLSLLCGKVVSAVITVLTPLVMCALDCKDVSCTFK